MTFLQYGSEDKENVNIQLDFQTAFCIIGQCILSYQLNMFDVKE